MWPDLPQELAATFSDHINAQFIGLLRFQSALSRGTTREPRKSRRGKSVEFDRDLFRVAKAGIVPLRVPKTRRARPASRGANNRCATGTRYRHVHAPRI